MVGVDPTARFAAEVLREDPSLEVIAAAIAGCDHDLDPADLAGALDALAARVPRAHAATLCRTLFGEGGLEGNVEQYDDPRNSYLDLVVRRRLGIPISLSVIAVEVGRRVGVPLVGIGMPGHFVVRDANDASAFYDPFVGGMALSAEDCERRFSQLHGPSARFDPSFLEPTSPVRIAERMLANLTRGYLDRMDRSSLAWVLRLRCSLPQADASVVRQFAGVLSNLGRWWEAADAFERLAALQPDRAEVHLVAAHRLRSHAN